MKVAGMRARVAGGRRVADGEDVALAETMKTEIPVFSPARATIRQVSVRLGDPVAAGQTIAIN